MNQFDLQPQDTRPADSTTTTSPTGSTTGPLGPVVPSAPSSPIPPYQAPSASRINGPVDTTAANWTVGAHLSAFAPGLTVEAARMTVRTAPSDTPA